MSKETKQLLEIWRNFLSEGLPGDYGMYSDPEDPALEGLPAVPPDPDLINPYLPGEVLEDEDDVYA